MVKDMQTCYYSNWMIACHFPLGERRARTAATVLPEKMEARHWDALGMYTWRQRRPRSQKDEQLRELEADGPMADFYARDEVAARGTKTGAPAPIDDVVPLLCTPGVKLAAFSVEDKEEGPALGAKLGVCGRSLPV